MFGKAAYSSGARANAYIPAAIALKNNRLFMPSLLHGNLTRPTLLHLSLLLVATVGLLLVAARVCVDEYHWFRNYWPGHPPVYVVLALRAIGPTLRCLSFSQAFVRVAIPMSMMHQEPTQ